MALGRMSADTRRGPRGGDEALGKAQPVSPTSISILQVRRSLVCSLEAFLCRGCGKMREQRNIEVVNRKY